jgi:hypothetical protein
MHWHEAIPRYKETLRADLQVLDVESRGYPAHVPTISYQISPTESWFTLFPVSVTLQNFPMPQLQNHNDGTVIVQQHSTFHVPVYAYLDSASCQMDL